jgi:hypothetical protein
MTLFNGQPTHDYTRRIINSAIATIEKLQEADFDQQAALVVEQAISSIPAVPVLNLEKKSGKRVTEERQVSEFGSRGTRQFTFIDISIPIVGNATALVLAPSTRTLGIPGQVDDQKRAVVIRFDDDDRLEAELERVIGLISTNLAHFENDMTNVSNEVRQTTSGLIARRKAAFAEQRERDSKRSFPIT